ncbi:MAG TPA: cysteine desulfurase family protein [Thermomicrobiales bacterium]|nr:cysteine desulfurase family protein [Thermomicrobiales bacterium]
MPADNGRTVYLDHAATTPVDPRVLEAMLPYFTDIFGNPSSVHEAGRDARAGLDWARGTLARILGCRPREVVFTGGATEANNLAIRGTLDRARRDFPGERHHVITTAIEHHAVLHAVQALAEFDGVDVTIVPVDASGVVRAEDVEAAIRPETRLISVMYANNEIGTIQPVAEIAGIARERGVVVHCDAVQAAGSLPLDVNELGVDLLSISAHKFYGPKGVGLLYVREGVRLQPLVHGGGQERALRPGTENVAGVVGMATALLLAVEEREERNAHDRELRDRLMDQLLERIPDSYVNGDLERRLPNNLNIGFDGVDGESVLLDLDLNGIAASSGSACASATNEPSHVLLAIGLDEAAADATLRLTVGRSNTREQIDRAIEVIVNAVERVRGVAAGG